MLEAPARDAANGCPAGEGAKPLSAQVSSGGLHSSQDLKDLGLAIAEDMLTGALNPKLSGGVVRAVLMTLRVAEYEDRKSGGESVHLGDAHRARVHVDPLAARERELLCELESIRKKRAAG